MSDEHRAILEDLKEFLNKKELAMITLCFGVNIWVIARHFPMGGVGHHFSIFDGNICLLSKNPIVSLADPDYKDKFYRFLVGERC